MKRYKTINNHFKYGEVFTEEVSGRDLVFKTIAYPSQHSDMIVLTQLRTKEGALIADEACSSAENGHTLEELHDISVGSERGLRLVLLEQAEENLKTLERDPNTKLDLMRLYA